MMDECVTLCPGVWKVETIGDAFFCECGVVYDNGSLEANIDAILKFTLLVHERLASIINPITSSSLQLRIGIHCGECVAGIVGTQRLMPHFCLFGEFGPFLVCFQSFHFLFLPFFSLFFFFSSLTHQITKKLTLTLPSPTLCHDTALLSRSRRSCKCDIENGDNLIS